jgi:hypothetical protein
VLIVPQVKGLHAFMEQAPKLRWIDYMLDHLAGLGFEKDDAAEWLSYFGGKKYDASYTLASEALGLPLVERLDDVSAQAMWSNANSIYVFTLGSMFLFLRRRLVGIVKVILSQLFMVNTNITKKGIGHRRRSDARVGAEMHL